MDVIKTLKDVYEVVQKTNDIELIQKVISAQEAVISMQDTIIKLQEENKKYKERQNLSKQIERYAGATMITITKDNPKIPYCSTCYGKDGSLIQMGIRGDLCQCMNCKSYFYFSNLKDASKIRELFK